MKKGVGSKIKSSNNYLTVFDGKVYRNFDTHINKSVPLYEWSHEIGLDISDFLLKKILIVMIWDVLPVHF